MRLSLLFNRELQLSHFMKNARSEKVASLVKPQAHLRARSQCKTVTIHGHMSKQRMPSQSDRAV